MPHWKMRGNWNPCMLLVRIEMDAAIWRNLEVLTQSNIFSVCSSGPALGFITPKSSTIQELRAGDDDVVVVGFNDHTS